MDGGMVDGPIDGIERIEKNSVQHVHMVVELIKPLEFVGYVDENSKGRS
jgi:hypothetical protein